MAEWKVSPRISDGCIDTNCISDCTLLLNITYFSEKHFVDACRMFTLFFVKITITNVKIAQAKQLHSFEAFSLSVVFQSRLKELLTLVNLTSTLLSASF